MLLEQLSTEELKKLLSKETRIFIDALDTNTNIEDLKATRKRINEIKELLEKKVQAKQNKAN